MTLKEQFYNDDRFKVKDSDIERIFKSKIKKYDISKIKVSAIKKNLKSKIIPLSETESYKFLDNKIDKKEYSKYCKTQTFEYEKHSLESFNNLVDSFQEYKLKDGAIVIDQFGIIRDGQHRASILLKKYGKDYEISVVKVYYKGIRIKTRIKLMMNKILNMRKRG